MNEEIKTCDKELKEEEKKEKSLMDIIKTCAKEMEEKELAWYELGEMVSYVEKEVINFMFNTINKHLIDVNSFYETHPVQALKYLGCNTGFFYTKPTDTEKGFKLSTKEFLEVFRNDIRNNKDTPNRKENLEKLRVRGKAIIFTSFFCSVMSIFNDYYKDLGMKFLGKAQALDEAYLNEAYLSKEVDKPKENITTEAEEENITTEKEKTNE